MHVGKTDADSAVALDQGLPYFGVALTELRYQEVLARLKVEAGIEENPSVDFVYGAYVCVYFLKVCDAARI